MRRSPVLVAALAALGASLLAAPAQAATTRVVDPAAGPYTTIGAALLAADPGDTIDIHQGHYDEELWVDKDHLTLRGAPGTIVSETSPYVVSLMGQGDVLQGLTIAGGPGGVRIAGSGAEIRESTVMADTNAITITGALTTRLDRVFARATAFGGTAIVARNDAAGGQSTVMTTSIAVGGGESRGVDAATGAVGDTAAVGGLTFTMIQSTIVGTPSGVIVGQEGKGPPPAMRYHNSISSREDNTFAFVNPAALDFHIREGAYSDVRGDFALGAFPDLPQPTTDYDGVPLPERPINGAFAFVEHPPIVTFTAAASTVRQGVPVRFDASGSSDPDPGGRIEYYRWDFGDGSPAQSSGLPTIDHAFAQTGSPTVTVTAYDQLGTPATSAPVTLTVTDGIAPTVTVSGPRERAKVHQLRTVRRKGHKPRHVVNVLKVAGRATDAGGVARVDVTLTRARQSFTSKAVLTGTAFAWHPPAKAKLARGTWTLTVRATDRAGNISAPGVVHFTVT
jgi:PKD repeat protein